GATAADSTPTGATAPGSAPAGSAPASATAPGATTAGSTTAGSAPAGAAASSAATAGAAAAGAATAATGERRDPQRATRTLARARRVSSVDPRGSARSAVATEVAVLRWHRCERAGGELDPVPAGQRTEGCLRAHHRRAPRGERGP